MAISVVNGYLCLNGCDAATARTGRDPHPANRSTTSQSNGAGSPASTSSANDSAVNDSAVVYGGRFSDESGRGVSALTASGPIASQSRIDLLA
jgi:hypothetical protein